MRTCLHVKHYDFMTLTKNEEKAIYEVNQRFPHFCRIAKMTKVMEQFVYHKKYIEKSQNRVCKATVLTRLFSFRNIKIEIGFNPYYERGEYGKREDKQQDDNHI